MNAYLQWGWRTTFDHVGATIDLRHNLKIIGQAMSGRTIMGFARLGRPWVDTRYRSIFAMAIQGFGRGAVSTRIEAFGTRGRGSVTGADDSEEGWAATSALRRTLAPHVTLFAEALRVVSRRDARLRVGLAPRQSQTLLQLAVRAQL